MNEKVLKLLENGLFSELKEYLISLEPADIVTILEELNDQYILLLFRLLPKGEAAQVFTYMESDMQIWLIESFNNIEIKHLFDKLFIDDAVDLIEEMPAGIVKKILSNTSKETRDNINEILKYPSDSAGSIMTIEFIGIRPKLTVKEAFDKIRRTGVNKETIYTCYVIDDNRTLLGTISVKDLLLSQYNQTIEEIMDKNTISLNTLDDKEFVAKQFQKYDFLAMPVVDTENRLVGIVTIDDAMDVLEEENEEDFAIMAAMTPNEDSYFKTSIFTHSKNRIVWLLVLMFSATITGMIINNYNDAITAIPILVSFMPMLMNTGGNCGSQSSTLIIRGLALDEIKFKDILKVVFKELRISIIVGAILSTVNGLRIYIMYKNNDSIESSASLAIIVALTLFSVVIIAKIIGSMLPMLAKKLKLDPAIMAAPLITTIVDTFSVIIFFKIATLLLHI